MRKREREQLDRALNVLRDPGGDGRTRVSHGFTGEAMRCVRCGKPTPEQGKGIVLPIASPVCVCGAVGKG